MTGGLPGPRGRARALWLATLAVVAASAWAIAQQFHLQVGWRVLLTAAAAAIPLVVAELRERFKQDDDLNTLYDNSLRQYSHRRGIPAVTDVSLAALNVTKSIQVSGAVDRMPPYVRRDKDDELDQALVDQHFILLVGDSKAGKSRMAAEAVRRRFPDRKLLLPRSADALGKLLDRQIDLSGSVVWLDNLEHYLELDRGAVARLLDRIESPDGPADVTVVASIRDNIYRESMPSKDEDKPYWPVLTRAHRIRVERLLTDGERARVATLFDNKHLLDALDRYGLAEYLAAGPDLVDRFEDGFDHRTAGAVVVLAVVGWSRTGLNRPMPKDMLKTLVPSYAGRLGIPAPSSKELGKGVEWARTPVHATSSLLVVGKEGYGVFDYVLEYVENDDDMEPVPDAIWEAALEHALSGDELIQVGLSALNQRRVDIADRAFRLALTKTRKVNQPVAAYNYALVQERKGSEADAETYYRRAADDGHVAAAYAAGRLLQQRGDLAMAKDYYERAARQDDMDAAFALGLLLRDGYRRADDPAGSGRDAEQAARWLVAAADAGHLDAAVAAGRLLEERGDIAGAERQLRRATEAHHPDGTFRLGLLLLDRSAEEGLRWLTEAAEAGHREAARVAGQFLQKHGDDAGAERFFRLAVDGPTDFVPVPQTELRSRRPNRQVVRYPGGPPIYRSGAVVREVRAREYARRALSDAELRRLTETYRQRLRTESMETLLPEVVASFREAARRACSVRMSEPQLTAGIALARGYATVVRPGQGRALVGALASYVCALDGVPVHVLARTDENAKAIVEWVGPIHQLLGLSVGVLDPSMTVDERRVEYSANVAYGAWRQFAFDYLRDSRAWDTADLVQRGLATAVVHDAAETMLDNAADPIVITASRETFARWYQEFARIVLALERGADYEVTPAGQVSVTESGLTKVEDQLGTSDLYGAGLVSMLESAIQAKDGTSVDVDYEIHDGVLVRRDRETGRLEPGLWGNGLTQAIQAKEGLSISAESYPIARIGTRGFFRSYRRLCPVVSTGGFDASAFRSLYGLQLVEAPAQELDARVDRDDEIFASAGDKWDAIARRAVEARASGRPVLVDVRSLAAAREASWRLAEKKVPHEVLTSENRQDEERIMAAAAIPGAVTVACGADYAHARLPIGAPDSGDRAQLADAGGLLVIGSERTRSRRDDDLLREVAGRNGEPGESVVMASREDPFFTGLTILGLSSLDGESVHSSLLTRAIRSRQRLLAAADLGQIERWLQWDNVSERHRSTLSDLRSRTLIGSEVQELAERFRDEAITDLVTAVLPEGKPNDAQLRSLTTQLRSYVDTAPSLGDFSFRRRAEVLAAALDVVRTAWDEREDELGREVVHELQRRILLQVIDRKWQEYLSDIDDLREVIALEASGQDILGAFTRRADARFAELAKGIKGEATGFYLNIQVEVTAPETLQP